MILAAYFCAAVSLAGMVAVLAGLAAVRRFASLPSRAPVSRPPVTILRPLCGAEPGLDQALDSLAAQAYPTFQIVLGIQDASDPAYQAARRFAARHRGLDIAIVVDATIHGVNRKISNLINMLPAARHGLLVFSDSDLHVAPDYLDHLVAALEAPDAGLATTVCVGRLARATLASRLTCLHMRHSFLPGALLASWGGRQDCLGNTMAIYRGTLARAGGLSALAGQLADDNVLGQLVNGLGLRIVLARTVTAATVTGTSLRALWLHELRWARTIRTLFPVAFASSAIHYPLFWAGAACLAAPGHTVFAGLLAVGFTLRAVAVRRIDGMLARSFGVAPQRDLLHLLIVRDVLSVAMVAASFLGRRVTWRGHVLHASAYRAPAEETIASYGG